MIRFFKNDLFTEAGSPYKEVYSPVVNDDGTIDLVVSGKENFQEYIQSFEEETNIHNIIARYEAGDLEALNKVQGVYGDFTKFPKTYAEMLQLQIDANKAFDELPVEVKKEFDNDRNKFFASIGTNEWIEKMEKFVNKEMDVEEEKVVEE